MAKESKQKKKHSAVILAAGAGKRLAGFETIKPLVKVGGKPLIVWAIEAFHSHGVTDIHIVVNHERSFIERELLQHSVPLGAIRFIEQEAKSKSMLDSIYAIGDSIQNPFFVTVCDLVFEKNPLPLFDVAESAPNAPHVLLSDDATRSLLSGANVKVRHDGTRISKIGKDITEHNSHEVGIYYFTPESYKDFVTHTKDRLPNSFSEALTYYASEKPVAPVILKDTQWFDVNTPATLIRAELFLRDAESRQRQLSGTRLVQPLKKTTVFEHKRRILFDVHVKRGIIEHLDEYEIIPHESYHSPHYLIVDKNIDRLYGETVHRKLTSAGYHVHKIAVDPGEWSKSISLYTNLANEILKHGIDKKSIIISLGGGVIKDLAGFLASTLYRGIGFVSIPTTVLSQCDAAIGLKQGVNGEGGKNLLGSFYAPLKVVVDPEVLSTLPERFVRDGLAECLKQAFAQDKVFYTMFSSYRGNIKNLNFLEKVVKKAIALKIASIQNDYEEEREALVNQYGHEVGHAVEYLSGYELGHGESVAIGMRVSAEIACILGVALREVCDAQIKLLKKYGLPYTIPKSITPKDILNTLRYNKKFHGGDARFVLVKKIGSLWGKGSMRTMPVPAEAVLEALERSSKGASV